jgi:Tfp pilus assembly protein PilE
MTIQPRRHTSKTGFTVVVLLVVFLVIGNLSGIVMIADGKWKKKIAIAQVKSDLTGAVAAMENARNFSGTGYPTTGIPTTFTASNKVTLTYVAAKSSTTAFCINAQSTTEASVQYYVNTATIGTTPKPGVC